jgi:hypothetical protein
MLAAGILLSQSSAFALTIDFSPLQATRIASPRGQNFNDFTSIDRPSGIVNVRLLAGQV